MAVIHNSAKKAEEEYQNFKNDICKKGKEAVEYIDKHNLKGIVLAGCINGHITKHEDISVLQRL